MKLKPLPLAILASLAACAAIFAEAPAAAQAAQAAQQLSLGEMLRAGGVVLWILVALSVVALALIIYYFVSLRRDRIINSEFFRNARGLATKHDLDGLSALCLRFDVPLSQIVLAAVEAVRRGDDNPQVVREAVESEGERQATTLWIRINILLDIAIVSPMVGLLGTVIGMIQAFSSIAFEMGAAKPILLASGVSKALTCTAAGLAVGIPAMILYGYFRGRVQKLVLDLEASASQVVNQLGSRRRERV
jgi:biopolymer transport protein ExbB